MTLIHKMVQIMSDERIPDLSAVASPPRRELDYHDLNVDEDPFEVGGQAIVYEARVPGNTPPDRIALKEPANSGTLGIDTVQTFLEEASTWETIDRRERQKPRWDDSEHIVGVIDTGDELPWIAMEYMNGGSLDDRLEEHPGGLPIDEALWIGECVCRGVELAHNYGIAHLDLKPANVLFREMPEGVWNVPKVADWGLARVLAEQSGTMEGLSVQYAAPEQFEPDEFGDPDMLTDVYQVGALVHALVTGDPPYTGSQLSVMRDVVSDEGPESLSGQRPTVSDELDTTVLTALATEKSNRYRNIAAFEQALRTIRTEGDDGADPTQTMVYNPDTPTTDAAEVETGTQTTEWPTFQGGPERTGHRPHASGPQESVTTQWCFQTNSSIMSPPVVVSGTAYIGGDDNVRALNAEDGTEQWTSDIYGGVTGTPTVVEDALYVGTHQGKVSSLDLTGDNNWFADIAGQVRASPAVIDGSIYIGGGDTVYALDTSDGNEHWTVGTEGWVMSPPAVVDGTVYITGGDTTYALNAADGTERWTVETGSRVRSSLAVADDTMYVVTGYLDINSVYALDATDGTKHWKFTPDGRVHSSPAVVDNTVYVGAGDIMYALDATDGTERWTVNVGGELYPSPAVVDDTIYVGSNNTVYALDAVDGTEHWTIETNDKIISSPAVVDGTVYIGSNDGKIYAIGNE